MVILLARDKDECERCIQKHQEYLDACPGVEILSTVHLEGVSPFDYVHEHFGYRKRITSIATEGRAMQLIPGSLPPSKACEFSLAILMKQVLFP